MTVLLSKNVPSARALARALGIRRYNPWKHVVPIDRAAINWGMPDLPLVDVPIINRPESVMHAANKLLAFAALQEAGVRTVPWTTEQDVALAWHNEGKTIYARTFTRGHGGRGIVVVRPDDPAVNIPEARLYTRFVKPDYEARVHVGDRLIIDTAQKKRRKMENPPPLRYWIRNYQNGWVFTRKDVDLPEVVTEAAISAVAALALDFGAVDVIVHNGRPYILEVNTAPGLQGTTLQRYAHYFTRF